MEDPRAIKDEPVEIISPKPLFEDDPSTGPVNVTRANATLNMTSTSYDSGDSKTRTVPARTVEATKELIMDTDHEQL